MSRHILFSGAARKGHGGSRPKAHGVKVPLLVLAIAAFQLPLAVQASVAAQTATAPSTPGADKQAETPHAAHQLTATPQFDGKPSTQAPLRALAAQAGGPQPPFPQCPPVGQDTSCAILIQVTDGGTGIFDDPSQGPFDGVEDTLIGVTNASSKTLTSLALSSDTDLFGFDGDGLCDVSPRPQGCPFGPTGYEGPGTTFSGITPDRSGGIVSFTGGLAPGATAYFSLEERLTATSVFSGGPGIPEMGGPPNPREHITTCFDGAPVNCATGVFFHEFVDFAIPGRGRALAFSRTYRSSAAMTDGRLGFGWTDSYAMSLKTGDAGNATVYQENGSAVPFVANASGGFTAPPRVLATLVANGDGSYTFTDKVTRDRYVFSASGQLQSEKDRNGYTTTLTYSGAQLTSVTDPAGRTLTFGYSGARLSTVTDPLGHVETFAYDAAGDLVSATDAAGRTWHFSYDLGHLLLTMSDPLGGVTTNVYDASGRVVTQTDPVGLRTTWSYAGDPSSPTGSTTTITDGHGAMTVENFADLELKSRTRAAGTADSSTTTYEYDPATLGITKVTDGAGNSSSATYDSNGNALTKTDPLGNTTRYSYNTLNEPTSRTTPANETTRLDYDANGNVTRITDPLGKATTYGYGDAQHPGDVTSITDPTGSVRSFTYDSVGNTASVDASPSPGVHQTATFVFDGVSNRTCEAAGNATAAGLHCPAAGNGPTPGVTTWAYDAVGQLVSTTDPSGHTTRATYDQNGNRVTQTDALGNLDRVTYDADRRPVAVTKGANGPLPSTTKYAYDLMPGSGNCAQGVAGTLFCSTTTDPNGQTTVNHFSPRNNLLGETRPDGRTTLHAYDGAGNETVRTNPAGQTTSYSYDGRRQPTAIKYSDGVTPKVTYAYDADGRRTSMTDGSGTTSYAYDADGRATSVRNGAGAVVAYTYDAAGRVTRLTYPGDKPVVRSFDGAGRLSSVTDWNGHATTFGYDADDNLVATTYSNGDTVTAAFDASDQSTRTQVAPSASPGAPLAALDYARNAAELVAGETGTGALAGATTYAYDAKLRLASVNDKAYDYDAAGNPSRLASTATQSFGVASQITKTVLNGTTTTYTFDAAGNRTGSSATDGATSAFTYDQANRLVSVALAAPAAPVVSAVAPTSGPAGGGTSVTLTGTGFTGATAVTFGSAPATYTVVSDTTITSTTPPGTGTVDVTVTTPAGTSVLTTADQFTYVRDPLTPVVRLVLPSFGSAKGGTPVLIIGEHFRGAAAVTFGGQPARFIAIPFFDWIIAFSPPGTGTVDVRVTTPHGTSDVVAADRFRYGGSPPPSVAPKSASASSQSPIFPPATAPASGDVHETYTYNGDGLRVAKQTAEGVQQFTWDHVGDHPRMLTDSTTSFIYGPEGLPVEQINGSGEAQYFFHDQLGSTRALLDATGGVAGTFAYDAYGEVIATTGKARTPLAYAASYADAATGFIYLINRYYDPTTAQFLTRDPIELLTGHPYSYAGDNPANAIDPTGLAAATANPCDCDELKDTINEQANLIKGKADKMINNPGGLPTFGPSMTWESHIAPFLGYQKFLVSLMDSFISSGCGDFEDLPDFAVDQAFRPVPEPNVLVPGNGYNQYTAPQPSDTGFHVPHVPGWVTGGVAVIGIVGLIVVTDGAAAPLLAL